MAEKKNEVATVKSGKPTKGRGGTRNFPNAKAIVETEEDRALVSKLLNETLHAYRKPRVRNDEELLKGLDDYFKHCADTGQIPTIEEMCLSIGYDDKTVWDWENGRRRGFSDETAEIIKKAKYFCKTFDAKLVISGKLNFLAYCFRAKNYYGMVDKQEVVLTPNQNPEDYSVEDIRKQYLLNDSATLNDSETEPSDFPEGSGDF